MKIEYLLMTPDKWTDIENSVFTQARLLASQDSVVVIGVYRTETHPRIDAPVGVRIKYLLDARRGFGEQPCSLLVPVEWDHQFSAESDLALTAYLRGTSADVVVTSTPSLAALAVEFCPAQVRVVHQEHCASMNRGDGITPLVTHGPRLDLLVSSTERNAQWLETKLGARTPPMQVVPNAFGTGFRPRTSLQNRMVVSAGPFVPDSRFGDLIKAFQTANGLAPGWRLRIYGEGPLESEMRYAVWRSGLAGMVDILPPTTRMAAELSKASIYALASSSEGMSVTALDAAAAGLPLIAYDVPTGPAEIIEQAGGGLLVPDGEPVSFGVALAYLMADEDTLSAYSDRARAGAATYSPEAVFERWRGVYRDVMHRKPRRQHGDDQHDHRGTTRTQPVEETRASETKESWLRATNVRAHVERRLAEPIFGELKNLLLARNLPHVEVGTVGLDFRIGLDEGARTEVIDALEAVMSDSGLTCIAQRGDAPLHIQTWSSSKDRPPTVAYATVFRVMDGHVSPSDQGSLVDIELWPSDNEGTRFAPRRNDLAEWVDLRTWEEWSLSGTRTPSGARLWNLIDFPIDVVYMWVDGADPEWDARRRARFATLSASGGIDGNHDAVSAARFVSRDEIYYSVSSVKSFMPWVRNIYIVTDGQVHQRVAAEFTDVLFVDHREIFPDTDVLPVFNSQAIESCLHRVPGLSEHFIVFNDDVLVARSLTPDAFFEANGTARFFPSSVKINYGANDDAPHLQAGGNNRELVRSACGFEMTQAMLHTPLPHLRSVVLELESRYPDEFRSTRRSSFRAPGDISALSSLAQYYGWATGRYTPGSLNYRYLRLSGLVLKYRMERILEDEDVEIVALGEPHPNDRLHQDERSIVKEFLETLVGVRTQRE